MHRRMIQLLHSIRHPKLFIQVHALIITTFPHLTPVLARRMCGIPIVGYARKVFDHITHKDQGLYNSLISMYTKEGLNREAIKAFVLMMSDGVSVDCFTIPPVLKCCSVVEEDKLGKQVHSVSICCGLDTDVYVQTALTRFYSVTGELDSAKRVFHGICVKDPISYNCLISAYSRVGDVSAAERLFDEMPSRSIASWNSLISCYANNGQYRAGLMVFQRMMDEKVVPNEITLVSVLSICAKTGDLETGVKIKKLVDDQDLRRDMILSTALMEMYLKCGVVDEARDEFDKMVRKDVVCWSAMIAGYAQNGRSREALELFDEMRSRNLIENDVVLVSVLSACADVGSVEVSQDIGSYIESHDLVSSLHVASALVSMYSKCGNIYGACRIFEKMSKKDIVSWNSMIVGLATNGFSEDAFTIYEQMIGERVQPNEITFVGLLTACSRAGLLEMGLEIFRNMRFVHGIIPQVEHYACVIDLFCRSGRLKDAYEFICSMEVEPNVVIWGSILNASSIHLDVELAELAVSKLAKLDPSDSWYYVLLSNIYSSTGRWKEALDLRRMMKANNVQKEAAYSWVEVENNLHKFLVSDTSHPRTAEVYNIVECLAKQSATSHYHLDYQLGMVTSQEARNCFI